MPEARAVLRIRYANPADARQAFGALHADDDAFVTTRLEDTTIVVEAKGTDSRSLLRAVDDVLACLSVAEDVMNGPSMERPNA